MSKVSTAEDEKLAREIGNQVAADLTMIIDRQLAIESVSAERVGSRVAGEASIHLAFRIEFLVDAEKHFGCLLLPLADAISIAGYLMVMSDEEVKSEREKTTLERSMKDAMLEVGNFVGGSSDAIIRKWSSKAKSSARAAGCQGVAPGAVPNFQHAPGTELILARLKARVADFESFEMIMMLPGVLLGSNKG